ncbi:HNH endonuclease signature motif containing protein [Streptomyces bikiniensis]|uniref:HNH endonuclease signature motif containing protein n=1 Tax=Streptomyces bikiniensis TaxID=1896 RepID=A0ABW8D1Z1_STRBI
MGSRREEERGREADRTGRRARHRDRTAGGVTRFLSVVGTDGRYVVSSEGTVWGPAGAPLKPRIGSDRRYYVSLSPRPGDPQKNRAVHEVVLSTFVGPRPEGHDGDHINRDPADNRLCNLRWLSAAENRGVHRGAAHHLVRLKEAEVLEMRRRAGNGEKARRLASDHGVSVSTVRHILAGRSWAWLMGESE